MTLDALLKLEAVIIVVMQALLAVSGYCVLAGQYDVFGIQMGELEISSLEYLFQGYLYVLTKLISTSGPYLGGAILLLIAAILTIPPMAFLMQKRRGDGPFLAGLVVCGLVALILLMPVHGIRAGLDTSYSQLESAGLIDARSRHKKLHTIQTDSGEKTGELIAASTRYTFLLIGTEVLKISNDSSKVVRVTRFEDGQ